METRIRHLIERFPERTDMIKALSDTNAKFTVAEARDLLKKVFSRYNKDCPARTGAEAVRPAS